MNRLRNISFVYHCYTCGKITRGGFNIKVCEHCNSRDIEIIDEEFNE